MSEIAIAEIALSGLLSSEFVPSRGAIGISLPIPVSRWRGGPSPGSVRQQPILNMVISRGSLSRVAMKRTNCSICHFESA